MKKIKVTNITKYEKQTKKWEIQNIESWQTKKQYRKEIAKAIQHIEGHENIEKEWENLKKIIELAATKTLGH